VARQCEAAAIAGVETGDETQERALPAAGGAHEADELPIGDTEVDMAERVDGLARNRRIHTPHALGLNERLCPLDRGMGNPGSVTAHA
jgi:hypothetical protein